MIFGRLECIWDLGLSTQFSKFTKEFDFGLSFFLLVSNKRVWAQLRKSCAKQAKDASGSTWNPEYEL